jgi:hypothetical protein
VSRLGRLSSAGRAVAQRLEEVAALTTAVASTPRSGATLGAVAGSATAAIDSARLGLLRAVRLLEAIELMGRCTEGGDVGGITLPGDDYG